MIWVIGNSEITEHFRNKSSYYLINYFSLDYEEDILDSDKVNNLLEYVHNKITYIIFSPQKYKIYNNKVLDSIFSFIKENEVTLIFISSSIVFQGNPKTTPFVESDNTCSITEEARFYCECENRTKEITNSFILRLSNLYGFNKPNIVTNIHNYLLNEKEVLVPNNSYLSTTFSETVIQLIIKILVYKRTCYGIYHVGNSDYMSSYNFVYNVYRLCRMKGILDNKCNISKCDYSNYELSYFPKNQVLDNSKFIKIFDIPIQNLKTNLAYFIYHPFYKNDYWSILTNPNRFL